MLSRTLTSFFSASRKMSSTLTFTALRVTRTTRTTRSMLAIGGQRAHQSDGVGDAEDQRRLRRRLDDLRFDVDGLDLWCRRNGILRRRRVGAGHTGHRRAALGNGPRRGTGRHFCRCVGSAVGRGVTLPVVRGFFGSRAGGGGEVRLRQHTVIVMRMPIGDLDVHGLLRCRALRRPLIVPSPVLLARKYRHVPPFVSLCGAPNDSAASARQVKEAHVEKGTLGGFLNLPRRTRPGKARLPSRAPRVLQMG